MAETLEIVLKEGAAPSPPPPPPAYNPPNGAGGKPAPTYTPPPKPEAPFDPAKEAQARLEREARAKAVNDAYNKINPPKPEAPLDPMKEARERLDRQEKARQVDAAYKQIAPPEPEKLSDRAKFLNTAGGAFNALGMQGLAGLSNAASAHEQSENQGLDSLLPVIGAAVALVKETAAQGIRGAGQTARGIASLDAKGVAEGMEGLARTVPVVGDLFADAAQEIRGFLSAISDTSRRLSEYNGKLAVANAKADVAQIVGDINRAQMLSEGLSRFTDTMSRISQDSQDIAARILDDMLPEINGIAELLAELIETVKPLAENHAVQNAGWGAFLGLVNSVSPTAGTILSLLAPAVATIGKIERNTRKEDDGMTNFLDEIGKAVNAFALQPQPQQFGQNLIPPNPFGG